MGGGGGGEFMGHCPILIVSIMNALQQLVSFELPVWFVSTTSSRNILLNTTSDYNFVVTEE